MRVGEIASQDNPQPWLVEQLWGASPVGLIGGAPKCAKTWLGLDLALSVAFSPDGRRIASGCAGMSLDMPVRVWDGASGQCLEILRGSGDVTAIAEGPIRFPWRALAEDSLHETRIEPASGGPPCAWFPDSLGDIVTHPAASCGAGVVGSNLYVIQLEGPPPHPSAAPHHETAPSDTLSPETRPT